MFGLGKANPRCHAAAGFGIQVPVPGRRGYQRGTAPLSGHGYFALAVGLTTAGRRRLCLPASRPLTHGRSSHVREHGRFRYPVVRDMEAAVVTVIRSCHAHIRWCRPWVSYLRAPRHR
jgi:hypothetical protein